MKKYLSLIKIALPIFALQFILSACPKTPRHPLTEGVHLYNCQRYEMLEDASGVLHESVSDTILNIYLTSTSASIFNESVRLDANDNYTGYGEICDNTTLYVEFTNYRQNLTIAYKKFIGDSTQHVTYISTAATVMN
jgi:hypothetical protein